MSKQAQNVPAGTQKLPEEFKAQETDLQMRFSRLSKEQREVVGNYLNAYNLAAWIYNVLLEEDSRIYIDLAMKFTIDTQKLTEAIRDVSGDPNEVQQIVDHINHGE